jgi:hypothetical protein
VFSKGNASHPGESNGSLAHFFLIRTCWVGFGSPLLTIDAVPIPPGYLAEQADRWRERRERCSVVRHLFFFNSGIFFLLFVRSLTVLRLTVYKATFFLLPIFPAAIP